MLRGAKVGLRARHESDIPILDAELHDDVVEHVRADLRPWSPISPGSAQSPYAIKDPDDRVALFSVVELASGDLSGEAVLWNIDAYNRSAHLGLALRPAFRGRGLGSDVVAVLCEFGFLVRGLHRLQIETHVDNPAMIAAASRNGFVREGVTRGANFVYGNFVDVAILGALAAEWRAARSPA